MSVSRHAPWRRLVVVTAFAALAQLSSHAAQAAETPSRDLAALKNRIDADQAQVEGIEATFSRDSSGNMQVAALFGESDEEKAARLQKEQAQDSSIATLNQRVSDMEETLRRLTGQMEQLDHRVSEFNDKIARLQKDFDYKLCAIAAQQLGATNASGDQTALPCGTQQSGGSAPSAAEAPNEPAGAGPVHLAPPPGVLGTLPQSAVQGPPEQEASVPTSPGPTATADTRARFDAAMNLLAKAQYDEARAAFRSFVNTYPRDDLAPQAMYWVGDIAYVQKDYVGAAQAFAEELKKFPSSPRAPESMLKLGQSLLAMNQKKEGCLALGAISSKYPGASKSVTEQAIVARRSARCR